MDNEKIIFQLEPDSCLKDLPEKIQELGDKISRFYYIDKIVEDYQQSHGLINDDITDEELFVTKIYPEIDDFEKKLYKTYIIDLMEEKMTNEIYSALGECDRIHYRHYSFNYQNYALPGTAITDSENWGAGKLECCRAWFRTKGENINVAVIDTGTDYRHELIKNNVWNDNNNYGFDFTGANPPNTGDADGHGTHCAGIIAAENTTSVIIGVAPAAHVVTFKIPAISQTQDCCNAIKTAVREGFRILSNSWEPTKPNSNDITLQQALECAHKSGSIVVVAAGNVGKDVCAYLPASSDYVISVAATQRSDARWKFDNVNSSNFGEKVTISAPGHDITSIDANTRDGLTSKHGTSMACPHVAGVIALLLSIKGHLSFDYIKDNIVKNGNNIGKYLDKPIGEGRRINAARSVNALLKEINEELLPTHCDPEKINIFIKIKIFIKQLLDKLFFRT